MSPFDIQKLADRKSHLTGILKTEQSKKKADRNQTLIADTQKRINTITRWLKVGEEAKEQKVIESMGKDEFKARMKSMMGLKDEPEHVMQIDTIEQLDRMYEKIKLANIQIMGPKHVLAHYRAKLKGESPHKR